ncbi:hypothetical protein H0260_22120, partial [Pectobacterium versatile]|nr:hypothetical protein [Pectobacterium versatile]
MYPVAAGNAFTVTVMAHFGYLVAVPQVSDIILRLLAAFAGAPPEWVITVEPALARRGVNDSELVTAV